MATAAEDRRAVLLRGDDNVAVAARPIPKGFALSLGGRDGRVREPIALGHKVALVNVEAGSPVRKYGQIIGFASKAIPAGSWVHVHNLQADLFDRDYAYASEAARRPPEIEPRTFPGYLRPDGRVGTRNYVAVISAVNCSASTSRAVAERFRDGEWRREFPNVDGVFAITHKGGCGIPTRGADHIQLERVLAGFANHPNVAACVLVGLGCEVSQARELVEVHNLIKPGHEAGGASTPPGDQHPGAGRDHQDRRGDGPGGPRGPARGQRLGPDRAAGLEALPGDGVRRLRRQLRA